MRSLQAAVRRGLGLALRDGAAEIEPRHLGGEPAREAETGDYHAQVHAFERELLERALAAANGNQKRAAERLGLSNQAWHRAQARRLRPLTVLATARVQSAT